MWGADDKRRRKRVDGGDLIALSDGRQMDGDGTHHSWRVAEVAVAMAYAAVSAYGKQRPVEVSEP